MDASPGALRAADKDYHCLPLHWVCYEVCQPLDAVSLVVDRCAKLSKVIDLLQCGQILACGTRTTILSSYIVAAATTAAVVSTARYPAVFDRDKSGKLPIMYAVLRDT